jgi:hypothetical protein
MFNDPITHLQVSDARHRARVREATLRHAACAAADQRWLRRPTRPAVPRLFP